MRKSIAHLLPLLALGGVLPDMKQTESVRLINNASDQALINEYKLIQQKKSKLSRNQRDQVEHKIKRMLRTGKITESDLD